MPKMKLEFDIPEEQHEAQIALNSNQIYGETFDLRESIRMELKHGGWLNGLTKEEALESIFNELVHITSIIEE